MVNLKPLDWGGGEGKGRVCTFGAESRLFWQDWEVGAGGPLKPGHQHQIMSQEGLPSCTGQQPFKGALSWNGPSENKFRGFKARFVTLKTLASYS